MLFANASTDCDQSFGRSTKPEKLLPVTTNTVAIRIDRGSAGSPDAAGATMRSCDGRERARHFRCACIDRDEHARGGVAEGHIQARAVGTEIQRAALQRVIEAALARVAFRSDVSVHAGERKRRFIQCQRPSRQHLAVRKIECERLPALRRLAARDVEATALPVDDRRGENPGGNAVEQDGLELARHRRVACARELLRQPCRRLARAFTA